MTANIKILTQEASQVMTVPSKALRYQPSSNQKISKQQTEPGTSKPKAELWVKVGDQIHPVKVVAGLNDDNLAEIKSGVALNDEIVLSEISANSTAKTPEAKVSSPFMPKRPGAKK